VTQQLVMGGPGTLAPLPAGMANLPLLGVNGDGDGTGDNKEQAAK